MMNVVLMNITVMRMLTVSTQKGVLNVCVGHHSLEMELPAYMRQ